MKRSLWFVISTLALANLIAMLAFAGWLVASGRLDAGRLEQLRALFSETTAQEHERIEREHADSEAETRAAEEAKRSQRPPLTAEDQLLLQLQLDEVMRQNVERAQRTLDDMRRSLDEERATLDADIARFSSEKESFQKMRAQIAALEGDEQFKKALALYESLRPKDAADTLRQIYDRGEVAQVVSYLNAMEARKASKVVALFDPPVAAELLERLRTRGLAAAPEER